MNCPPRFWDGVLRRLGAEVPAYSLEAWLRPLAARTDGADERLRILCPSQLHLARVRDRYLARIERCVEEEAGRRLPIELAIAGSSASSQGSGHASKPVSREPASADVPESRSGAGAAPPQRRASPLQRTFPYTFGTFVVGSCNALAREAAFAVAHGRQQTANLLYLCSKPGNGKTHLARAIASQARHGGSDRVVYASAETFTSEFMASIRLREMERFKRRFRNECDLLLVEDVQFLDSKKATQLELFHTLIHLLDVGARVVLSGDRLPRAIDGLDPRLRSQMTAGLVAGLEPPDASVRRRILKSKAAHGGVRLPEDCLDLLVSQVLGSVRDLEGVLIQLVASASLLKRSIDLELTREALHKLSPDDPAPKRLQPRAVIEVVARHCGTTPEVLASRTRRSDVMVPRQLAMYLCSRYTDASFAAIGRVFGRQHPSVSNAVRKVEREILERAPLRYRVETLAERLEDLSR